MHGLGEKYELRNLIRTENRVEQNFRITETDDY
jgi:hypothetical protein